MEILGFIPARGGSKGIPNKNIRNLGRKPLISYTIEEALKSNIHRVIVSTEDEEIAEIARSFFAEVPFKRPTELAKDTTKGIEPVLHALKNLSNVDNLLLLQPTSPLRNTIDIDSAFDKLFLANATALISVCEYDNKILKAFKENEFGYIEGISNNNYPFIRRQDLPKTYLSNGAIYIIKVEEFLNRNKFFTDKTVSFVMDAKKSIDLDTLEDLEKIKRELE